MLDDCDCDYDYERDHDYDYDYERDHEYDHDYKFPRMQASLHSATRHSPPHTAGDGATKCSSMRANFERGGERAFRPPSCAPASPLFRGAASPSLTGAFMYIHAHS